MYAIFENDGVLDFRAMTVMGINSKPSSDNPIGYFGTGLKYAIAVAARLGLDFYVQDGCGQEYKVEQYESVFRDKTFNMMRLINVNDQRDYIELPFTTELGKNWEMWMLLREIECNMRDEGGEMTTALTSPSAVEGKVRFIIKGEAFYNNLRDMRRQVFFDVAHKNNFIEFSGVQCAPIPHEGIYNRNVLVVARQKKFAWTYNFKDRMTLTEDRTLKYSWEVDQSLELMFCHGPNEYRKPILENSDAAEWDNIGKSYGERNYTEDAMAQIEQHYDKGGWVNERLRNMIMDRKIKRAMEEQRDLADNEKEIMEEALERLDILGYDITNYKIVHSQRLPNEVLGLANHSTKTIYIAARNFEQGLECLMGTLLEEFVHLHYGFSDESRQFQDWLLRQTIVNGQRYIRSTRMGRKYRHEKDAADMESETTDASESERSAAPASYSDMGTEPVSL